MQEEALQRFLTSVRCDRLIDYLDPIGETAEEALARRIRWARMTRNDPAHADEAMFLLQHEQPLKDVLQRELNEDSGWVEGVDPGTEYQSDSSWSRDGGASTVFGGPGSTPAPAANREAAPGDDFESSAADEEPTAEQEVSREEPGVYETGIMRIEDITLDDINERLGEDLQEALAADEDGLDSFDDVDSSSESEGQAPAADAGADGEDGEADEEDVDDDTSEVSVPGENLVDVSMIDDGFGSDTSIRVGRPRNEEEEEEEDDEDDDSPEDEDGEGSGNEADSPEDEDIPIDELPTVPPAPGRESGPSGVQSNAGEKTEPSLKSPTAGGHMGLLQPRGRVRTASPAGRRVSGPTLSLRDNPSLSIPPRTRDDDESEEGAPLAPLSPTPRLAKAIANAVHTGTSEVDGDEEDEASDSRAAALAATGAGSTPTLPPGAANSGSSPGIPVLAGVFGVMLLFGLGVGGTLVAWQTGMFGGSAVDNGSIRSVTPAPTPSAPEPSATDVAPEPDAPDGVVPDGGAPPEPETVDAPEDVTDAPDDAPEPAPVDAPEDVTDDAPEPAPVDAPDDAPEPAPVDAPDDATDDATEPAPADDPEPVADPEPPTAPVPASDPAPVADPEPAPEPDGPESDAPDLRGTWMGEAGGSGFILRVQVQTGSSFSGRAEVLQSTGSWARYSVTGSLDTASGSIRFSNLTGDVSFSGTLEAEGPMRGTMSADGQQTAFEVSLQ